MWLNVIGWTATAVFSSLYFFKEAATLRRIQAAAASLWVLYGVAIHSSPVVVANLIVGIAAKRCLGPPMRNRSGGRPSIDRLLVAGQVPVQMLRLERMVDPDPLLQAAE